METRSLFKALLSAEKILCIFEVDLPDKYWVAQKNFIETFRTFLNLDFSNLTGKEMLKLCALVSRYRPVEPVQFLTICAKLAK